MASTRLVRTVYRSLLRESQRMKSRGDHLKLPPSMSLEHIATRYGRGSYTTPVTAEELQRQHFPKLTLRDVNPEYAHSTTVTHQLLTACTRHYFRSKYPQLTVDDGLQCLSTLNRLRQLAPSYSVTRTEYTAGTSVSVELATSFLGYLPEHVMAANGHWPFGYRVKVTNTGNKVVQLVSRHWLFESADGRVIEVPKGSAGVVGHAPVLEPGQAFEYYSGTQLSTRSGSVRGSFTMVVGATDERFEAKIAPTALMGPPERVAAGQESLAGKATVNA